MSGLAFGAEEALLEDADLRLEFGDLNLEMLFTLFGPLSEGAIISSLLASLKEP
jgi:hypothetical protein